MIRDWKVDLNEISASHLSGFKIKKLTENKLDFNWMVVSGKEDKTLFEEGIKVYEHEYSKWMLNEYVNKYDLPIDKIILISNNFIEKENLNDHISKEMISSFLSDEKFFSINTISTIRAAIYFYKLNEQGKFSK